MIADLDILVAIARQTQPIKGAHGVANILDVESDEEFTRQLTRLVNEEKIDRWHVTNGGFQYVITNKGRELLIAEGVDVVKLAPTEKRKSAESAITAAPAETPKPAPAPAAATIKHAAAAIHKLATETKEHAMKKDDLKTTLEKALAKSGNWERCDDLADEAGVSPPTARKALHELLDEKRIQHVGAYASSRFGKLGLDPEEKAEATSKPKSKRASKKATKPRKTKTRKVKTRAPYTRHARTVETRDRVGAGKEEVLEHAVVAPRTIAAFSSAGEIVIAAPGGVKVLDAEETRKVIELVREFDEKLENEVEARLKAA